MAPALAESAFATIAAAGTASASTTLRHLTRRQTANDPQHTYVPGQGVRSPDAINNNGFFALFAILGAAMVLASIWFFFWAKHGGFVWRREDWEDYKSSVLRRKGPDGKTLSNATPRTHLGEKSIAGTFHVPRVRPDEMTQVRGFGGLGAKRQRAPDEEHGRDNDLAAYRRERAARVGGLNAREQGQDSADGTPWASRSDLGSDLSQRPLRPSGPHAVHKPTPITKKERKAVEKATKKAEKQARQDTKRTEKEEKKRQRAGRHVFAAEASTVADSSVHPDSSASQPQRAGAKPKTRDYEHYLNNYRPAPPAHGRDDSDGESAVGGIRRQRAVKRASAAAAAGTPGRRTSSPLKPQPRPPGSWDDDDDADSDSGTKTYRHVIPELSSGASGPSAGPATFRRAPAAGAAGGAAAGGHGLGNIGARGPGGRLGGDDSDSGDDGDLATFRRR